MIEEEEKFEDPNLEGLMWESYALDGGVVVALALRKTGNDLFLLARGIAICAQGDYYDYFFGRNLAKARAVRVMLGREVKPIRNRHVTLRLIVYGRLFFSQKGYLLPIPTVREIGFLRAIYPESQLLYLDHEKAFYRYYHLVGRQKSATWNLWAKSSPLIRSR